MRERERERERKRDRERERERERYIFACRVDKRWASFRCCILKYMYIDIALVYRKRP